MPRDRDLMDVVLDIEDQSDEILERLRRIETRHVKLLMHLGLNADGTPASPEAPTTETTEGTNP